MTTAWHTLDAATAAARLETNSLRGLDSETAQRRLTANGPNVLREAAPIRPWKLLAEQFKSPLVLLLFAAALVSGAVGEWVDSAAISIIVILNAVIGFFQEYRAEQAIAALKKMTAPSARVLRNGRAVLIPAAEIVVGDVLLMESGDLVAADARLLQVSDLHVREAALTGESLPVEKDAEILLDTQAPLADRMNLALMGTSVVTGTGRAVVTATGMNTEIGHIAGMLEAESDDDTPLQKQLTLFGKWVLRVCLVLVGLVFVLGLLRGLRPMPMFLTSVSLAVAAVPEGLTAVVTIALALGVKRMARRRALIRRLPSVETLGATEIICTDKTGTLTRGEMTVRELYVAGEVFRLTGAGLEPAGEILHRDAAPDDSQMWRLRHLASIHVGCNNADLYQEEGAWHSSGDPTEAALLSSGRKIGTYHGISEKDGFLQEYPFDSDTKRHGIFRRLPDGKIRLLMNGAPDVLLGLCSRELSAEGEQALTEEMRRQILEANAGMAERALRVIASAYRDFDGLSPLPGRAEAERDLVFTGLAGIQDAPRPEAAVAVAQCHEAGIRVLMITGDHPRTALAVARELGIARDETEVISGSELDAMPEEQLREAVQRATVFARVTAGHKLRIVKALRSHGAVTAMTGDGVNDAPALKASDIGIAMGRGGTEVTKQAADLVLADDNFASIVAAVEEGRGVYFNIRKSLQYLLAGNAGELLVMILPMLWGWPLPLLPVHLLWINLVTDGLPALVLAADPADASLMRRKPRNHGEQLANRSFILGLLGTGCLTAGVSLIAFWIGLRSGDIVAARADAFDTLVLSEVFRALAYYSEERPFWRSKWRSLRLLLGVVFGSLALQIAVHEIPLFEQVLRVESRDWKSSGIMIGLSLIPLIVLEARKVFFRKF